MSDYVDPITGKRPQDMNIVEWCDWEYRARNDFYRQKREAIKRDKTQRREDRVEHIESMVRVLSDLDAHLVAEKIDQAYYPEAWGIAVPSRAPRRQRIARYLEEGNET